jgi:hypothetical protein
MTKASPTSTTDSIRLSLSIAVLQEVIQRHRRRARIRNLSGLAGGISLASSVTAIFLLSPPLQLFVGAPLLVVGALLAIVAVVLFRAPLLSDEEGRFLGVSQAESVNDFELRLLELRDRRRQQPEPSQLEYQTQYQDDILFYVSELRSRGMRSRRANNVVQIITIVGSLAATALGSLAIANDTFQWMSPAITFVVGAASGVAAIYKFKDRSFYAQQTANAIDQELGAYNLGIGRYEVTTERSRDAARTMLVEEIHRLRTEQENREQNLDQPAQKEAEGEQK